MLHASGVAAEGFGLRGPRGTVFRDVTFTADPGSLVAIEGPSGAGRTCLLLALTGRMRATRGRATVAGHPLPKKMSAVRRISALGPVAGIAELEPALTVAEHLRERDLLLRRYGSRPSRTALDADTALRTAGLALDGLAKGARTAVRDLERLEALRLGVALALMARPLVLGVDDTDHKLEDAEREQAWRMLRDVAAEGVTVLAVCTRAPVDSVVVRTRGDGPPDDDDPVPEREPSADPEREPEPEPAGKSQGAIRRRGTADAVGTANAAEAEDTEDATDAATGATDGATPHKEGTDDAHAATGRA